MAIDQKYLDEVTKAVKGLLSENRQKIDEAFLQAPGGIKISVGIHIKGNDKFKVTMSHSQKKIDCEKEVDTKQQKIPGTES